MSAETMTIGLSSCPNDTYIFHALLHGLVPAPFSPEPHMADVEELNGLARQKRLPVSKISLGVIPYIMDDYAILSSGAALGWGCGLRPLWLLQMPCVSLDRHQGLPNPQEYCLKGILAYLRR